MLFNSGNILTQQQLKRLTEHKYVCDGNTLLDPYMQKFWQKVVLMFPKWVAPNLITVIGLAINAFTTAVLIYHSPDARQVVPAWTLLLFAFGLFAYQTLDACDGKQARRTSSSSPLGELFDHGCDSLSTVFVAISACIAVQLGDYPSLMFYQCIAASTLFYAAHWQTYVSSKLRFGKFDVTEAQFCIILMHILSAIFGVQVWSVQVPYINFCLKLVTCYAILIASFNQFYSYFKLIFAGGVGKNGSTVAIKWLKCDVKLIPIIVSVVSHLLMVVRNFKIIFGGGVGKNGSTVAGTSVLSPFIPIAIVVLPAFIIYQKSTTNLVQNYPCIYLLTFGAIIAKITNKLVIAHMTKSEMEYLDTVLIGPILLIFNQYFNTYFNEHLVLWIALIYTIFDILVYASNVYLQISSYLNIYIFSIKPRVPPKTEKSLKSSLNDAKFEPQDKTNENEIRSLLANQSGSDEDAEDNQVSYDPTDEHFIHNQIKEESKHDYFNVNLQKEVQQTGQEQFISHLSFDSICIDAEEVNKNYSRISNNHTGFLKSVEIL